MGSGIILCNAIKKYGKENFTREIVQYFSHQKYAYCLEAAIVTPELIDDPHCYNLKCGGIGGMKGYKMSDETKQKMSKSRKGQTSWCKGKHLSEETKKKISQSNTGKHGNRLSEEAKKKMSKSAKQRITNNGFICNTLEADQKRRQKISISLKGRKCSDETKEKLRKSNIGKTHKISKESHCIMSKAKKGRHWKVIDGKRVWYD